MTGTCALAEIVPPDVVVEEDRIAAVDGPLWPEEISHVASAVETRRLEFAAGRVLSRRALARLGGGDMAIPAGTDRAPVWPPGFTGSISHSGDRVAAAVARADTVRAIGIDIEDIGRFRPELERHILRPEEIVRCLDDLDPEARRSALALLFSAKEAFYKCQYAITRQYLGFHDASVRIDHDREVFELSLLQPLAALPRQVFRGRFRVAHSAVAAALVLRKDDRCTTD